MSAKKMFYICLPLNKLMATIRWRTSSNVQIGTTSPTSVTTGLATVAATANAFVTACGFDSSKPAAFDASSDCVSFESPACTVVRLLTQSDASSCEVTLGDNTVYTFPAFAYVDLPVTNAATTWTEDLVAKPNVPQLIAAALFGSFVAR